jgi:hypothetical protein
MIRIPDDYFGCKPISTAEFVLKLVVVLLRSADSYVSAMEMGMSFSATFDLLVFDATNRKTMFFDVDVQDRISVLFQIHAVRIAAIVICRTPEVRFAAPVTPILVPVASIHRKIHTLENFKVLASLGKNTTKVVCLEERRDEGREISPLSSLHDTPFFSFVSSL